MVIKSLRCYRFLVLIILPILLVVTLDRQFRSTTILTVAQAAAPESCDLLATRFITWDPAEIECPICQTKNTFMVWGSYGNYIYQFPSKYQLIFWPYTDNQSWYSCKKCRFSAFMEDFKNVPKDKISELQKMLEGVSLPAQKEHDSGPGQIAPYLGIPVSERLSVVEKVNRILGHSTDDYWSHFYRVLAYHLAAEKKQAEADQVRQKVLTITERLLNDKANDGRRKELLFISGAMRHYLRDDTMALTDFETAKKLKYSLSELKAEQNKNYDQYLSHVIDEYIDSIHKGKGPKEQLNNAFID